MKTLYASRNAARAAASFFTSTFVDSYFSFARTLIRTTQTQTAKRRVATNKRPGPNELLIWCLVISSFRYPLVQIEPSKWRVLPGITRSFNTNACLMYMTLRHRCDRSCESLVQFL